MVIALLLLALLFIFGFITTYFNLPTKKITAWFESISYKTPSQIGTNPTTVNKKVEKSDSSICNELRSVFSTFDKNKDGYITKQELRESLKNIGIVMAEKDVTEMVEKVDSNKDGLVDFDEFCELFGSMGRGDGEDDEGVEGDKEDDLKEAFNVFDGDGDGLISVEELGLVLSALGFKEGNKLEDCKEMIRNVDVDGDGMVNLDEFKMMMKGGGGGGRLVPISFAH